MKNPPMSRCASTTLPRLLLVAAATVVMAITTASSDDASTSKPIDLRTAGAFGFDQSRALLLCDTPELRVSALSDGESLFVQAVVWGDDDAELGQTEDGRPIGDNATLKIAVAESGELTPERDRSYSLDPWPRLPGLHYSIQLDESASTGLRGDSMGRGSIQFVETAAGTVRVDSFLIPIAEIGCTPDQVVRVAYWASSPSPMLIVNSVGFEREGQYWSHHLPRSDWHRVSLAAIDGVTIDAAVVPEGRGTIEIPAAKPRPEIGSTPPEFVAENWLNWDGDAPPSLTSLRGKVVVVEFWATWCGPCIAGIPKLNEMHEKYGGQGMVLLSLSDQPLRVIEEWIAGRLDRPREQQMHYVVGAGSTAVRDYGVTGIPAAFVIDRDGKLVWSGHPSTPEFEEAIVKAIESE